MNTLFKIATVTAVLSSSAIAAEGWMTDFEAAKKKAAAENKALLVDFTGSDWCGWCIRLDKEVFQKPEFKGADKFVLVSLDFPRNKKKQSEKVREQNAALQKKYGVRGFPTILLMDAEGRPFAKTGYQAGGPEKYNEHLDSLLVSLKTRDDAFAAADKLEDKTAAAKQKSIALEAMSGVNIDASYPEVVKFIVENDPDNFFINKGKLQKEIKANKDKNNVPGLIEKVDALISKENPTGERLQKALLMKLDAYFGTRMIADAAPVLDAIVEVDAETDTGKMIKGFRDGRYKGMLKASQK